MKALYSRAPDPGKEISGRAGSCLDLSVNRMNDSPVTPVQSRPRRTIRREESMSYQQNIEVPPAVWNTACSNLPYTLGALTEQRPLLLVFLRHLGCTFCRQALADLKKYREDISGKGVHIGLVHMVEDAVSLPFFEKYGLADLPRFSDPEKKVYHAFGLKRAGWLEMMGVSVWLRGFQAGIVEGHGFGPAQGDVHQMPGVFLLKNRTVLAGYLHQTAGDRPDYCKIADSSGL